jgi:hypothetical protein
MDGGSEPTGMYSRRVSNQVMVTGREQSKQHSITKMKQETD